MKKIVFLSAMVLFLLSAFATDTPAYAPHGVHAGFHPVYGHGMHLRPVYRVHKPFHPVAGFYAGRAFADPVSITKTSNAVRITLPSFAEADAVMNATAVMSLTEISLPGFVASDAAINDAAIMEMTEISLPDFTKADAEIDAEFNLRS